MKKVVTLLSTVAFIPSIALACVQTRFSWGYFLNWSEYGLYIKLSLLVATVIFLIMFRRNKIARTFFIMFIVVIFLWLLGTTLFGLKC